MRFSCFTLFHSLNGFQINISLPLNVGTLNYSELLWYVIEKAIRLLVYGGILSSKDLSSSSCYTSPSNISNINLLTTRSLLREPQTIQPYLSHWEGYGLANAGYYFQAHEGQEKIIRNSQHSFLKGRSCLTSLINLYDEMTDLAEVKRAVAIFYLYFSNTFTAS